MAKTVSLPDKIKIGPLVYSLIVEPNLKDECVSCMGTHSYNSQELKLDENLPTKEVVMYVLWHELFHAIWDVFNLPEQDEERMVDSVATGMMMILKDNPDLLNYMHKALK